jgi:hypothetical protein
MNYLAELAARIRDAVPPSLIPEDADDLFLLYAVLAESRGVETSAEDVHTAWTAWMFLRGEDHESMVPFVDLPPEIQAEDEPFAQAIRSVTASERERDSQN